MHTIALQGERDPVRVGKMVAKNTKRDEAQAGPRARG